MYEFSIIHITDLGSRTEWRGLEALKVTIKHGEVTRTGYG